MPTTKCVLSVPGGPRAKKVVPLAGPGVSLGQRHHMRPGHRPHRCEVELRQALTGRQAAVRRRASVMKGDSSLCATSDCRLTSVFLPDCTAHFGALPQGCGPMPRSLRRWTAAQEIAPSLPGRNRRVGFVLDRLNTYNEGCSASAARQAVAGERWSSHGLRRGHPQARTVGG